LEILIQGGAEQNLPSDIFVEVEESLKVLFQSLFFQVEDLIGSVVFEGLNGIQR